MKNDMIQVKKYILFRSVRFFLKAHLLSQASAVIDLYA